MPPKAMCCFDVPSMRDYGKLSDRSLDEMIAGARVEVAPYKKRPDGLRVVEAVARRACPAGTARGAGGRPGWHIECSAMGEALLGATFDIHGGGIDLVFPHHENEIAQSECVHGGAPLANVWMHNGFVQMEGEKMAKSEGNVVAVRALLEEWTGRAIRFALLQTHYRQPQDWTVSRLESARQEMGNWAGLYSVQRHTMTMFTESFAKFPLPRHRNWWMRCLMT